MANVLPQMRQALQENRCGVTVRGRVNRRRIILVRCGLVFQAGRAYAASR